MNQLQELENPRPIPAESPPVHPFVAPLSYLLGTWRGQGEGEYPTISSFRYGEELRFSHSGKPVIAYTQKTWKLESGAPMHAESGYFRPKPDGSIEVVIAQSTGLVEVQVKSKFPLDLPKIMSYVSDSLISERNIQC
ncbi:Calycin [Arabidopsis suecica]|uniref:Calycin n=1 Tax=Arabidopsis suecica TaxID=45249 RepID=A0A8T2BVV0_ARASU|nr:Calycin [Arabidopsis suecica]